MPVDKSWMQSGRSTQKYFDGVAYFIDYAYNHIKYDDMKIYCPCNKCSNRVRLIRNEVHQHLLYKGIKSNYTKWYLHGEDEDSSSDDNGENVPDPAVWNAMVDERLNPQWQDQSNLNKTNRKKSTIVHTTGSISFAKYKKDELDRTGIKPSPIDCFKKFHVIKGNGGEGESWRSEKAKEIYETMENEKSIAEEENLNVNDWDIYKEVIVPSHGRILGLGGGLKSKDLYSSSQNCNKCRCVELEESHQQLKDELKNVKGQLSTLQEQVQMLLNNNQNSKHSASQSPFVDNVGSNGSDANISNDFEE